MTYEFSRNKIKPVKTESVPLSFSLLFFGFFFLELTACIVHLIPEITEIKVSLARLKT